MVWLEGTTYISITMVWYIVMESQEKCILKIMWWYTHATYIIIPMPELMLRLTCNTVDFWQLHVGVVVTQNTYYIVKRHINNWLYYQKWSKTGALVTNTANTFPRTRLRTILGRLLLLNKMGLEVFTRGGSAHASREPFVVDLHLYDTISPGQTFSRLVWTEDSWPIVAPIIIIIQCMYNNHNYRIIQV